MRLGRWAAGGQSQALFHIREAPGLPAPHAALGVEMGGWETATLQAAASLGACERGLGRVLCQAKDATLFLAP